MSAARARGEDRSLLLRLLRAPDRGTELTPAEWELVVRQGARAGVLARLCVLFEDRELLEQMPERPRRHLEAARTLALKQVRDVRWDVICLERLLAGLEVPIILLKGAAYVMADLPPARGRLFGDIDIMVPLERIEEVERTLLDDQWFAVVKDPYDQRYYRRWTHQIPPLQHMKRDTVLDVHHTIVPPTARSAVAADPLAEASRPLADGGRLRVLSPADMVLHSAVHLFNEGEFDRGLRDLLDIADLLDHFGTAPDFWPELIGRAEALGLTGPFQLALRQLDRLLALPLPQAAREASQRWRGSPARRRLFDALLDRAMLPDHPSCDDPWTGSTRWLLYVRAHYLRMPLHLLLPHLLRKAVVRPRPA